LQLVRMLRLEEVVRDRGNGGRQHRGADVQRRDVGSVDLK
jgi:hypothetical protein